MKSASLLLCCAVTGSLGTLATDAVAATVNVYVYDFSFSINLPGQPVEDAVINLGDTIQWVWLAEMHNTVSCVGQLESWESDIFMPGDRFVYTFTHEGVFTYYCAPHGSDNGDGTASGMAATITVLPIPGPSGVLALALGGSLALRRRR